MIHKETTESEGIPMKKSKLEIYLDILRTLFLRQKLELNCVMQGSNCDKQIDQAFLNERLDFLAKVRLIKKVENDATYHITHRGITIFAFLEGYL